MKCKHTSDNESVTLVTEKTEVLKNTVTEREDTLFIYLLLKIYVYVIYSNSVPNVFS